MAAVFAVRTFINDTSLADRLVASQLVEDTTGTADVMIVMGAGVVGDCEPNQNAVQRVLLAARLFKAGRAPIVLFTGGAGRSSCPVATAMARLAEEIGIPKSQILVETAARNTQENADLSIPLLHRLGAQRLLVVTDRLHMRRSVGVFSRWGFAIERATVPIYRGHPNNVSMLIAGIRERVAVAYYESANKLGPIEGSTGVPGAESTLGGEPAKMTLKNPDGPLVLLGASYAQHWGLQRIGAVPVINRGVGGQRSIQLLERFDADVVSASPRAVLIWGFINDITGASPEALPQAVASVRSNYQQMIAKAEQNGIEVILAAEVTLRPPNTLSDRLKSVLGGLLGKESFTDRVNRHVMSVNHWLRHTAQERRLLLVDLGSALADERGYRRSQFIQPDGSHLTESAYEALTSFATPILEEHVSKR